MQKIEWEADETIVKEVETILDDEGLSLPAAVNVFFKRVIRERSVAFLFSGSHRNDEVQKITATEQPTTTAPIYEAPRFGLPPRSEKMTKIRAVRRLTLSGYAINRDNVTFASKNRSAYNYWANPSDEVLQGDWSLILNDWKNGKLYLFAIPAGELSGQLVMRSDMPNTIDLQIAYNDPSFTDNRSGVRFVDFLKGEIEY